MKKLVMVCLVAMMVACPAACVNDPTSSEATCLEATTSTATDACSVVSTDTSTEE